MTAEREGLAEIAGVAFDALPCSARCYQATRGHHSGSCVMKRRDSAQRVADALADLLAARDRRVRAEALREAADTLDSRRSAKGIASRALDPGVAMAVAFLRDEAPR